MSNLFESLCDLLDMERLTERMLVSRRNAISEVMCEHTDVTQVEILETLEGFEDNILDEYDGEVSDTQENLIRMIALGMLIERMGGNDGD